MKSLQRGKSVFLLLGSLSCVLVSFDFLLTSPHYEGFLTSGAETVLLCCAIVFITAAIVLHLVQKALQGK